MGLCLLFDTIDAFEELRLAFLMGHPIELDRIRRWLFARSSSMNYKEAWTEDLQEAYDLSTKMRLSFSKYGHRKIEEAHVNHPRHDCTVLEEIEFEAVLTQCDSSTTGTGGFLDDLPDT